MPSPFDRVIETVRPHLPGVIDRAIKQELFLLCHDFFKNSLTWRNTIEFTILAGDTTATVNPAAGRIYSLLEVKNVDDIPVSGIYMTEPGEMKTHIAPTEDTTYYGTFSLTVTDPIDADSFPLVPNDTIERYTDEFVNGIKARMMIQPSKPYTNPQMASYYMSQYMGGRARARNDINTGYTYGSQRWAFPQTFRVR